MKHLTINVPVVPSYEDKLLQLEQTDVEISFPLEEGEHKESITLANVGQFIDSNGETISATITVSYKYDKENEEVEFYGNDFESKNSTTLNLYSSNDSEFCSINTYSVENQINSLHEYFNKKEAPTKNILFPRLQKWLRRVNDMIIEQATTMDLNVFVREPLPEMTEEEYQNLSFVCKDNVFEGLYDPSKQYESEYEVLNLKSTWGGTVTFRKNERIANVIGSDGDPKIASKSWIKLWEENCNGNNHAQICTSSGFGVPHNAYPPPILREDMLLEVRFQRD